MRNEKHAQAPKYRKRQQGGETVTAKEFKLTYAHMEKHPSMPFGQALLETRAALANGKPQA